MHNIDVEVSQIKFQGTNIQDFHFNRNMFNGTFSVYLTFS